MGKFKPNVPIRNSMTRIALRSGRFHTWRNPSVKLPFARWARSFACSVEVRRSESESSTATKETPLIRKAQPVPTEAMTRPDIAGPIMRAALNEVELSAIAFGRPSSLTSSATKVWRTGASNAAAEPNRKANT